MLDTIKVAVAPAICVESPSLGVKEEVVEPGRHDYLTVSRYAPRTDGHSLFVRYHMATVQTWGSDVRIDKQTIRDLN